MSRSNIAAGFLDIATYDDIERLLYSGCDSYSYFLREVRKSSWFTLIPCALSRAVGQGNFGQEWSAVVSRAGDFVVNTWLRVTLPAVTLRPTPENQNKRIRWCRNIGHHICREISFSANDLQCERFDSFFLDYWASYTISSGKKLAYNNMIGNISDLIQPHRPGETIGSVSLNLPIPLWYTRDSGVSLAVCSLPYNELRINLSFRNWNELLIVDTLPQLDAGTPPTQANTCPISSGICQASDLVEGEPQIRDATVWATYAIVSAEERKRLGCQPRDVLMEQVQVSPIQSFNPEQNASYDLRFSHPVKLLLFGVRNRSVPNEWSNWTTSSPVPYDTCVDFSPPCAHDPISEASILYENSVRCQMPVDYYSLIQPFYFAPTCGGETGLHMYSYALDWFSNDPTGSTNFSKLSSIQLVLKASQAAIDSAKGVTLKPDGTPDPDLVYSGCYCKQSFEFVCMAINWNILRLSSGSLGFPII